MGAAVVVIVAGGAGYLCQPWLLALTTGRAPHGHLDARARTWLNRYLITVGSAVAGLSFLLPAPTVLALAYAAGAVLAWWLLCIDAAIHKLPDPLVALLGCVLIAGMVAAVLWAGAEGDRLVAALIGGGASYVGFTLLGMAPGRPLGFGDVKLAAVLGGATAWFGFEVTFHWVLLSFLTAGGFALVLLVLRRLRTSDMIAFGPWLILGAAAAIALHTLPGVTH